MSRESIIRLAAFCLCLVSPFHAWEVGDIELTPKGVQRAGADGGLITYVGQASYTLSNPQKLPLFARLSLVPEGSFSSDGFIPYLAMGSVGALEKATGPQEIEFHCRLPASLQGRVQLRLQVDDAPFEHSGNIRHRRTRVFHMGSSITETGEYVRFAEALLSKSQKGGEPVFRPTSGMLQERTLRQYRGTWTDPTGDSIHVHSYGWSGASARSYAGTSEWMQLIRLFGAHIVVIESGINDGQHEQFDSGNPLKNIDAIEASYGENLEKLVDRVRLLGALPVLMSTPAAYEGKKFGSKDITNYNQVLSRMAGITEKVAREKNCRFIDLYSKHVVAQKTDPGLQAYDGIHPTEAGHRYIAEIIHESLGYGHSWRSPNW